jgi:hypothetical protein
MQREAEREAEADLRRGPELLARAVEEQTKIAPLASRASPAAPPPATTASGSEPAEPATPESAAEVSVNARGSKAGDAPS